MFKVNHKVFGNGLATFVDDNKYLNVEFDTGSVKKFVYPDAFEKFLTTDDSVLLNDIDFALKTKKAEKEKEEQEYKDRINNLFKKVDSEIIKSTPRKKNKKVYFDNKIIGRRSQRVSLKNKNALFEAIGYMCTPGRLAHISAEVPDDDRSVEFEMNFPGQPFTRIKLSDTPSGIDNKFSSSFRLNFNNVDNCPNYLNKELRDGGIGYAARINKTGFVYDLVTKYGFKFGKTQDVEKIKSIACELGYEEDFNRGYCL